MIKNFKYKLRPTKSQEERFNGWIGSCRLVYNMAKDIFEQHYAAFGKSISFFDLKKQLPEAKKEADWLKDVPSATLQQAVERLERSFKNFFANRAGYPKWAKKQEYNSLVFKQQGSTIKLLTHNRIQLPKIGSIKFFNSRTIPQDAKIKKVTLTRELDGYYISVCLKIDIAILPRPISENQTVGLDMGVKLFFATSDGQIVPQPEWIKDFQAKIEDAQRILSRKQKGSNNRKKARWKLQKLWLKYNRKKQDWQHKLSAALTERYSTIIVEDLKIGNMSKSSKGTIEAPGKQVAQKSGLNRAILSMSWGEFFRQLGYKQAWKGGQFVKVSPYNTSKECNQCGHTSTDNRLSQAKFKCQSYKHEENADINAAKNIKGRDTSYLIAA